MKKNMQELADALGLSRTTVSLVLKGKGDHYRISRKTQERILNLAKQENFKPNFFAQALNRNSSRTIGVVFPDVFEEFMVEMIRGIGEILEQRGYTLILMTSRFRLETERKNLEELFYRGADGILLAPTCRFSGEEEDRSHIRALEKAGLPLVMIDRIPPGWEGPRVVQDDRAGGASAARFLREAGCRNCLAVSLDLTASTIKERLAGFREECPASGAVLLKEQNAAAEDLTRALKEELSRRRPDAASPLGLFVTTAGLALRVKEILSAQGLTLNREFRIIRFGSDPRGYASGMAPIPQPHYRMGREGASVLLDLIERKKIGV